MSVNIAITADASAAAKAVEAFSKTAAAGLAAVDSAGNKAVSRLNSLSNGSKITAAGFKQMREQVNVGKDALQSLTNSARLLGADVAPQLTFGISAASDAFKAMSGSAKLGASSMSAYALGVGVVLLGWKAAIDSVRESLVQFDKEVEQRKADAAWKEREKSLLKYIERFQKAGKLSEEEARLARSEVFNATTPEKRAAISDAWVSKINLAREQLEKERVEAATELATLTKELETKLLTGVAAEKAKITKELDALVAKGTEASVKLGVSSQPLLDLANQVLKQQLGEVDAKRAQEKLEAQRKTIEAQARLTQEIRTREQRAYDFYAREEEHARRMVELEKERSIQKIQSNPFLDDAEKYDQAEALGADMTGVLKPRDLTDQMIAGFASLRTQWGTLQQQIAAGFYDTVNNGVNAVSEGITGLIFQTEGWRQKLAQIPMQILQGIVGAIVQLGVRTIATMILTAIAGKAIAATSTAALIPIAAAQTKIWTTPAALATIASYGGAAAASPFQVGAAIGATKAITQIASAGYDKGGYTGDGGRLEVAGLVHRGEVVWSQADVANVGGVRNAEMLRKTAGAASSAKAASLPAPKVKVVLVADLKQAAQEVLKSDFGEEVIIETVFKNKRYIGIPT